MPQHIFGLTNTGSDEIDVDVTDQEMAKSAFGQRHKKE
jgi:hypothetical protein